MRIIVGGPKTTGSNPLEDLIVAANGTYTSGPWYISDSCGGNRTVYGDFQNILGFTVNNSTNNTSNVLSNINVSLEGNNIKLGNGNNTVFGNIQDMNFTVKNTSVDSFGNSDLTGDPTQGSGIGGNLDPFFTSPVPVYNYTTAYDVGITDASVVMGGNTIKIGNGTSVIYGSMRDLSISDTGGHAETTLSGGGGFSASPYGSQVTVNTMINNLTIDLTGGSIFSKDPNTQTADGRQPELVVGQGNTITAGNGNITIYGNMRDLSIEAGGASANSTTLPSTTAFVTPDFSISPNIQAITDIQGLTFTVGGNHISAGNGSKTIYGDMESLSFAALPNDSYGYNSMVFGGVGDLFNTLQNFFANYRSAPPYFAPTAFDNLNFNADTITVGNGVNVIYGHLQTLNLSVTGGSTASPGDFFLPVPGLYGTVAANPNGHYDPNSFPFNYYFVPPDFLVQGATNFTSISSMNITMGTFIDGVFKGNIISAGIGNNTIYGDIQNIEYTITGGTMTGTFPSSSTSSVYTPLRSGYSDPINWPDPFYNTIFMAGNTINSGLCGSSVNTIYGSMQDLSFHNTTGTNNQGLFNDAAEFCFVYVLGGSGTYGSGLNSIQGGPAFTPLLTGNTITVGNGLNLIYGNMRDFYTSDSGGISNGFNNPLGLNGQPATTSSRSPSFPGNSSNLDNTQIFMGYNHITTGNGQNTVYGAMRDLTVVGVGGLIENVPTRGTDFIRNDSYFPVYITGNTITTGNGINLVYGDMRDLTFSNIGGVSSNISLNSKAYTNTNVGLNLISMGDNFISSGSGNNTIYGAFHDILFSSSGGFNTGTPALSNSTAFDGGGAGIMGTNITIAGNTIYAGICSPSLNNIFGDGNDIVYSVVGGIATDGFRSYNQISSQVFNGKEDSYLSMGHNVIYSGKGCSTIYGDIHALDWSVKGGQAAGAGSFADGIMHDNQVHMGGNTIHVLGGSNTIYGDAQTISLSVLGGTVSDGGYLITNGNNNLTSAEAHLINAELTLAGNSIFGGSGNDTIYVNLQNLKFSATDGSVSSGTGKVGASFTGDIIYTDGDVITDTGSHIFFGKSTVDAGLGNDTIIGSDVLNLNGVDAFLKPAGYSGPVTWHNNLDGSVTNDLIGSDKNTITFGDEMLTGGLGNDQFVFTLLNGGTKVVANQGSAEITDFNGSGSFDKLVLYTSLISEHTAAALDADHVATFTNSAAGTLISFNGAGSIMLDNVTYTSFVNMGAHLVVA